MNSARFARILSFSIMALAAFTLFAFAEQPPGFGINKGNQIERGFVFWKGTYIEPPYVVARYGLALYINDIELEKAPPWPPYDYRVDKDPGMPHLTEKNTWEDLEDTVDSRNAHWRRKLRYLYQHLDPEEARKSMVDYFRKVPFVKSAELESEDSPILVVKELSGRRHRVDIGKIEVNAPPTKEEMINSVDRKKSHLEERLMKGDCYFFFGGGSYISFAERKAARVLPEAIRVLRSNKSIDEKRKRLQELEIVPPESKAFDELITGFKAASSLDGRAADLERGFE